VWMVKPPERIKISWWLCIPIRIRARSKCIYMEEWEGEVEEGGGGAGKVRTLAHVSHPRTRM
jgi:hypothetical protein